MHCTLFLLLDLTSGWVLGPETLNTWMALTIQLLRGTWELEFLQLWDWHKVCLMARVDIFMDLGNLQLRKSFAVVSKSQITRSLRHGADHIGSVSRHLCACCDSLEYVCLQPFIKNFAQAAAHQHPSSTHELFWHNSHRPDCEQIFWCKYLSTLGCLDAEGLSNFDYKRVLTQLCSLSSWST